MPEVTDQQLIDAGTDATNYAAVTNGAATDPDVVMRSGVVVKPLAKVAATMAKGDKGDAGPAGELSLSSLTLITSKRPTSTLTNLQDPSVVFEGWYRSDNGVRQTQYGGHKGTELFPVIAGGVIRCNVQVDCNHNNGIGPCAFDVNGAWISGDPSNNNYAAFTDIPVPAGAAFMTLSYMDYIDATTVMVMTGSSMTAQTPFVGFGVYARSEVDAKVNALTVAKVSQVSAQLTRSFQPEATALNKYNPALLLPFNNNQVVPTGNGMLSGFWKFMTGNPAYFVREFHGNSGYNASGAIPVTPGVRMSANVPVFGDGINAGNDGIVYVGPDGFTPVGGDGGDTAAAPHIYAAGELWAPPPVGAYFAYITTQSQYDPATIMVCEGAQPADGLFRSFGIGYDKATTDAKITAVTAPTNGVTLSNAITPSQAASLIQAKAYEASRRARPASYIVPRTGRNLWTFGTSITAGLGLNGGAGEKPFGGVVAANCGMNWQNFGVSSDEIADCINHIFTYCNSDATQTTDYIMEIGANDLFHEGVAPYGGQGAHEVQYNNLMQAAAFWLATRKEYKVYGGSVAAANWSNDTTFAAVTGAKSTTNGASFTFANFNTYGKPIYLWYRIINGDTGTFNVVIDGSTAIQLTTGQAIATSNGASSSVAYIRVPVAAGAHNIQITQTAGGTVSILAAGTMAPHTAYVSPRVVITGMIPVQGELNWDRMSAAQSRIGIAQYCANNLHTYLLVKQDGGDVTYGDTAAQLQDGALALFLDVGNPHPNAAGHALMGDDCTFAMQLPPDVNVLRAQPPANSKGTPGDTWCYNGTIYGVNSDQSIHYTATTGTI